MQNLEKYFQITKGVLIAALIFVGANVAFAVWNEPDLSEGPPPAGNTEAPIDVSATPQTKAGALIAGGLRSLTDVVADERFQLKTGAGSGLVLTSDATGFGTWQTSTGGGGEHPVNDVVVFRQNDLPHEAQVSLPTFSSGTQATYDQCALSVDASRVRFDDYSNDGDWKALFLGTEPGVTANSAKLNCTFIWQSGTRSESGNCHVSGVCVE